MASLSKSTVSLRGHHLICLHFFDGEGYSPEYVQNLTQIVKRARSGEKIEVAVGADDVCGKCPSLRGGRCFYSASADEEIRDMDVTALKLLGLTESASRNVVQWSDIQDKLSNLFPEWAERYCRICSWRSVCERQEKFRALAKD